MAKRRDYALAGIPSYLVVDLRSDAGELWLYEERDADGLFSTSSRASRWF